MKSPKKYQWLYLQLTTGKVFKNFTELLFDGDKLVMGSVGGLPSLEESDDDPPEPPASLD